MEAPHPHLSNEVPCYAGRAAEQAEVGLGSLSQGPPPSLVVGVWEIEVQLHVVEGHLHFKGQWPGEHIDHRAGHALVGLQLVAAPFFWVAITRL